jgi:hypothetical protein
MMKDIEGCNSFGGMVNESLHLARTTLGELIKQNGLEGALTLYPFQ